MTTTTPLAGAGSPATETYGRRWAVPGPSARLGLCALGLVMLGAWGGVVAFVGPVFGYRSDAASSWDLSLNHVLLYLAPGALGFLSGLALLGSSRRARRGGGRASGLLAGIGAAVAGLWFLVGPVAWPVINTALGAGPFVVVPATPLANLANQVGYNLGVGALVLALGAVACDAAVRRRHAWLEASGPWEGSTPMAAPGERAATDRGLHEPATGPGQPATTVLEPVPGPSPTGSVGPSPAGSAETASPAPGPLGEPSDGARGSKEPAGQ